MTNGEKYKTPEERSKAFVKYCKDTQGLQCQHSGAFACSDCAFKWLADRADIPRSLPCPFCGSETHCDEEWNRKYRVKCNDCWYSGGLADTAVAAVAKHNRYACAVAREKEASK